jgi:hypothetical protein
MTALFNLLGQEVLGELFIMEKWSPFIMKNLLSYSMRLFRLSYLSLLFAVILMEA